MPPFYRSIFGIVFFFFLSVRPVHADNLQDILRHALTSAPEIREAGADVDASRYRTEQAKSEHWPLVTATGNQIMSQYHDDRSDYDKKRFTPGVKAQINLFSFGAVEKNIERSRKEEEFYRHKYVSTREELAYTIGQLYLRTLNMKESLRVMKKSLNRHKAILADLNVIVASDEGRESEYVQAQARMLAVQQNINRYTKQLETGLNTLSKYAKTKVTEKDLTDPFKELTDERLFAAYSVKDKRLNPAYRAQHAELEAKRLALETENKKELPKINLVGSATRDDRYIGMEVSWDILNRGNNYGIHEKASEMAAAHERLDRISRDIEETAALARINIKENRIQLKTLQAQVGASAKVVDFYKMQFGIARRSLLDVLNAERELAETELALSATEYDLRVSILEYLYSQGMIATWGDVKPTQKQPNF